MSCTDDALYDSDAAAACTEQTKLTNYNLKSAIVGNCFHNAAVYKIIWNCD